MEYMDIANINEMKDDDKQSIYSQKIENGLEAFRKEHSDEPNVDIVRCVKRVIWGDKKGTEHESLETLAIVFREIVKICNLTPQEYDSIWSVNTNKKMFLDNISRKITALASDEDKEECAFQRKRLLFKIVYPEYYKTHFTKIEPKDLVFINGDNKAALSKAAKPLVGKDENSTNEEINSDGAIVDRLMMATLKEALKFAEYDIDDLNDQVEIMKFLTNETNIKAIQNPNSSSQKNQIPPCFEIIKTRQCYASFIDFYFFNLPPEEQIVLVDDYMEIRRDAGIKENPLLDKLYDIFQQNREEFIDALSL